MVPNADLQVISFTAVCAYLPKISYFMAETFRFFAFGADAADSNSI